jgi:hypothetical protein
MRSLLLKIIFSVWSLLPIIMGAQNELLLNGESLTTDCAKIVVSGSKLDTLNTQRVKIYHAEISNNCLEIGIVYNNCNANIELVTDNIIVETESLKLYLLLKYIETPKCKTTSKTKVSFDLTPFKNLRTGHYIIISFLGENYNLIYK